MRKLLIAIAVTAATFSGIIVGAESALANPWPLQNAGDFYDGDFAGSESEYGYWSRNYAGSICLELDFMELCYREEDRRFNNHHTSDEFREQQRRRQQLLQREQQRRARELQLRRRLDQLYRDFPELRGVPQSPNQYWRGPNGDIYDNRGVLICRARQSCILHN